MREADAFTGLILRAGPAEQVEDTLIVLGRDAPAVVAHIDPHPPCQFPSGAYPDLNGSVNRPIFCRIVEEIAEDLVERKTIRDNLRHVHLDANLASRFRNLVMHGGGHRFQKSLEVDLLRFEGPAALPRNLEDGIYQSVHLAGRTADEAYRLRQVLGRGCSRVLNLLLTQRLAICEDISLYGLHRLVQFGGKTHDV